LHFRCTYFVSSISMYCFRNIFGIFYYELRLYVCKICVFFIIFCSSPWGVYSGIMPKGWLGNYWKMILRDFLTCSRLLTISSNVLSVKDALTGTRITIFWTISTSTSITPYIKHGEHCTVRTFATMAACRYALCT